MTLKGQQSGGALFRNLKVIELILKNIFIVVINEYLDNYSYEIICGK